MWQYKFRPQAAIIYQDHSWLSIQNIGDNIVATREQSRANNSISNSRADNRTCSNAHNRTRRTSSRAHNRTCSRAHNRTRSKAHNRTSSKAHNRTSGCAFLTSAFILQTYPVSHKEALMWQPGSRAGQTAVWQTTGHKTEQVARPFWHQHLYSKLIL